MSFLQRRLYPWVYIASFVGHTSQCSQIRHDRHAGFSQRGLLQVESRFSGYLSRSWWPELSAQQYGTELPTVESCWHVEQPNKEAAAGWLPWKQLGGNSVCQPGRPFLLMSKLTYRIIALLFSLVEGGGPWAGTSSFQLFDLSIRQHQLKQTPAQAVLHNRDTVPIDTISVYSGRSPALFSSHDMIALRWSERRHVLQRKGCCVATTCPLGSSLNL